MVHGEDVILPVSLMATTLASKLIFILSHPAEFGFWVPTLLDNILLNVANKQADQRLSAFRLASMQWHMLSWRQNCLFLIRDLLWVILTSLQGLVESYPRLQSA